MAFSEQRFAKGFCQVPNEILLDKELRPVDLAVYWVVRSFMYGDRTRWAPSYEAVAKRANCSKKSARRAVRCLEDHGWLIVHRPKPSVRQRKPGRPAHVLELVKNRTGFLKDHARRDQNHARHVEKDWQFEAVQVQAQGSKGAISREEANVKIREINAKMKKLSPRVPVLQVSTLPEEESA